MKRIGGLKQQAAAGLHELTDRRPHAAAADRRVLRLGSASSSAEQRGVERRAARAARRARHPRARAATELSRRAARAMREYYLRNIFPLVTPLAMDPAHPFPFVSNLSLNLLVTLRPATTPSRSLARVKVPVGQGIPRFLRVDGHADASCRSKT